MQPGFGESAYYRAEIAAATEGYERVVMLGDSMGATGALMHADKASAVVAFSPQVGRGERGGREKAGSLSVVVQCRITATASLKRVLLRFRESWILLCAVSKLFLWIDTFRFAPDW